MRLGVAIHRAAGMDPTWTTLALASAALRRGHLVRFIEPWDFGVDEEGRMNARAHAFDEPTSAEELAAALSERRTRRVHVEVAELDLLMLRAAPLHPTVLGFAMRAKDLGVQVVNDPDGIARVAQKSWLPTVPGARTPRCVVTQSQGEALMFYERHRDGVVVKPARGSGGRGVSFVAPGEPASLEEAFRSAQAHGAGYVVVQGYLSGGDLGERRLVWLDGEVIGGYLRRRAPGEFRHNLKQGGVAEPLLVSAADQDLVEPLAGPLRTKGIRLAGIDVIDGYIIEVNAVNPGGTFHADRLNGSDLSEQVIRRFEAS